MKTFPMISFLDSLFNLRNIILIKRILFLFFINIITIHSLNNFKAIYLSSDYYYVITTNTLSYYNNGNSNNAVKYTFTGEQIITSAAESEMISFDRFTDRSDVANLVIVKHYVYAILNNNYFCNNPLNEIRGYPSEVYAISCPSYCYFVVGIVNSSNQLHLYLYRNTFGVCDSTSVFDYSVNNVGSTNFNCQIMLSSSMKKN